MVRNAFDAAVSYGVPAVLGPNVVEWVKDEQDLPRKKPRLSKGKDKKVSQMKKSAGQINRESGNASVSAAVVKRGGKTHRYRKPTKAGPTKLFKELVHRSIHDIDATGTKTDHEYFYMPDIGINAQSIGLVDMKTAFTASNLFGITTYTDTWMFHPYYFLDAASVLFNNKPASQNGYLPTTANTLGYGTQPGLDNAQSPNGQHARFTVTNSFESWLIKNNTQRQITLKVVLCEPKNNSTMFTNTYDINTGTFAANGANDAIIGPSYQWAKMLFDDRNQALTQNYPENLRTLPMHTPNFNQNFKTEVTEIVLEPGTSYNYHVEGPKDLEVNFEKYFVNDKLMDIRKYCRAPIFIWHGDIVGNSASKGGLRYPFINDGTPNGTGVYIERKKYCKIQAPMNLIGPMVTAFDVNKPQQIAFNRPRYFTYVWAPIVVPSNINIEVNKENPQALTQSAN